MAQRETGVYKVLERPTVYSRFQSLLGGPGAIDRFVREFVRPAAGARVLDVGCGTGSLLAYLPANVSYTGFDINPAYIEAARKRFGERGRFFCARVGEEPREIGNGQFDLVIALALLHHLSDDEARHLLDTAVRVLAPGGAFVSIDPTLHEEQSWLSALAAKLDRGKHVRSPDGYRQLIAGRFANVESSLLTDLLNIPYSHCVVRAFK